MNQRQVLTAGTESWNGRCVGMSVKVDCRQLVLNQRVLGSSPSASTIFSITYP
ncbi:hypothetical protein SPH9361_04305 [Sphingobium sp. CECT 9361]|nr:hypothetical protein SPH9361_04305 [Sphingobium sp. CECT 9361]